MREPPLGYVDEFFAGVETDYWDPCLMEGLCPVAWSGAEVTGESISGGGPLADSVLVSRVGDVDVA